MGARLILLSDNKTDKHFNQISNMANINKNNALSSLDEALDNLDSFPNDNVYTILDQVRYCINSAIGFINKIED